jgi:hypothetical protein
LPVVVGLCRLVGDREVVEESRDVGVLAVEHVLIADRGGRAAVTDARHERSE